MLRKGSDNLGAERALRSSGLSLANYQSTDIPYKSVDNDKEMKPKSVDLDEDSDNDTINFDNSVSKKRKSNPSSKGKKKKTNKSINVSKSKHNEVDEEREEDSVVEMSNKKRESTNSNDIANKIIFSVAFGGKYINGLNYASKTKGVKGKLTTHRIKLITHTTAPITFKRIVQGVTLTLTEHPFFIRFDPDIHEICYFTADTIQDKSSILHKLNTLEGDILEPGRRDIVVVKKQVR
jgi:hypothetical protein